MNETDKFVDQVSLSRYLDELNKASSEEAKKRFDHGERTSRFRMILAMKLAFIRTLLAGDQPGVTRGWAESFLAGYRQFLIHAKLWELEEEPWKTYEKWR